MFSRIFVRIDLCRIFFLTSSVVLLTGCGSNISNTSSKPTPIVSRTLTSTPSPTLTPIPGSTLTPTTNPTPSPTFTPTPSPTSVNTFNQNGTPVLNRGPLSIDVSGLLIQSTEGIQCALGLPNFGREGQLGNHIGSDLLVLAADRFTYSQDEIQLIANYLNSIFTSGNTASSFLRSPPTLLNWVPGSQSCTGAFQITNTGNIPIQISAVGIQVTQNPQQNSYNYRTIDACTVLPASVQENTPCGFGPSGAGNCSVYFANIHLQGAKADSVFIDTPTARGEGQICPGLIISPSATTDLYINFVSSDKPNSLVYSVLPEFTLSDANGTNVVPLPQLASVLAFADSNQISCYGLQGNTFVQEMPRTDPNAPPQYCM
jgi:hypothetical protein